MSVAIGWTEDQVVVLILVALVALLLWKSGDRRSL